MGVYYFVILSVIVLGLLAQYVSKSRPVKEIVLANGEVIRKNHYSIFYYILVFIFCFVSGFRYYIGTDYGSYWKRYNFSWDEIVFYFKELDEPLLKLISFLARTIWDDGVFVVFVFSAITLLLTFYGISKYDYNEITIFLLFYIFTSAWTFTFNGVRQALACAIVFAVTSSVDKRFFSTKAIIKIIIGCCFAYLAHKSALLLIPIILLSRRKVDLKQVLIILICAISIPLFFDNAFAVMEVDLENESALEYINHAINPIRVLVAFVPLVLFIFIPDKKRFFLEEGFIINMEFFHVLLTLTTMNSAYMNRITQYTVYFTIVFLVKALRRIYGKTRWVITIAALVLYFAYWHYGITTSDSMTPFAWSFSHIGEY